MSDRKISTLTGDFVAAPKGAFASSDDIENMIVSSYLIAVGSWEGDPDLGHRFNELARATDTTENRNRLADLARDAVKWLVDLGKLDHVDVTVQSIQPGIVAFEVDYYTPGATTPKRAGAFLVPVGAA